MDEFVLQAVGRLYLDNLRLQMLLQESERKDSRILELTNQVTQLSTELANGANQRK